MSNKTILERIIDDKQSEIDALYSNYGLEHFKHINYDHYTSNKFYSYLSKPGLSLIAEIKKASPSKGIIRQDFEPITIAKEFLQYGASALSILTEKNYFLGAPEYIQDVKKEMDLPIIRKDFIVDPIQIYEAKHLGASAILLIKAALDMETLQTLHRCATEIGLDVLVEIHSEEELNEIKDFPEIKLVGVNNRNLNDFSVDLNTVLNLAPKIRHYFGSSCLIVAESGYSNADELKELENMGIQAVLIGEGLAKQPQLIHYFNHD